MQLGPRGVQELVPALSESHGHAKKAQDEGEAPTVGVDYTHTRSEREKEKENGVPSDAAADNKTKMTVARVAPSKGVESCTVETVKKMVERLGHRKIIRRSDDGPAILALKEAVRGESDAEIVLEEAPVRDHQGLVEIAIKNAQGHFRMIKDALDSRHGRRAGGEHQVAP